MNIIMPIVMLILMSSVWAEDISLVGKNANVPQEKVVPNLDVDGEKATKKEDTSNEEFEQMKKFLIEENERLKTIKILNLDLERASLELKKREVEVKISDLNNAQKGVSVVEGSGVGGLIQPLAYRVMGIFRDGDARQAIINTNGRSSYFKEGQSLGEGVLVKLIDADSVLLQYADGKEEKIDLGS